MVTLSFRRFLRGRYTPLVSGLFTDQEADEMVARWIGYGHEPENVRRRGDGVWIKVSGQAHMQVQRDRIIFHGQASDAELAAGMRHAQEAWGGKMYVHGPEEFKIRNWAMARVAGVEIMNYTPPAHLERYARDLVTRCSVDLFNKITSGRRVDGFGNVYSHPWWYRCPSPTRADIEFMNAVARARGLKPLANAGII